MVLNKMKDVKIYLAGHRGMVGSAILKELLQAGFNSDQIITKSKQELDLRRQDKVEEFLSNAGVTHVIHAAGKVGGIHANSTFPADFIIDNILIETNVIWAAFKSNIKNLIFLGSSCIYPRLAHQPIKEEYLLTGSLEPTNEPYALAKICGIKICASLNRQYGDSLGTDYRCLMPTNLYGPGDNYHPLNSHVLPALISKFHEAKVGSKESVVLWGTGSPLREFLYVDDLAKAVVFLTFISKETFLSVAPDDLYFLNVGSGEEISIFELANAVSRVVGFRGKIEFDETKPDGTPRKLLDSSRLRGLGWSAQISLVEGLVRTYNCFVVGRAAKNSQA